MPFSPHDASRRSCWSVPSARRPLVGCSAPAIGDVPPPGRGGAGAGHAGRLTPTPRAHRLFRDRIEQAKADDTATSWEQHRRVDLDR